MCLGVHIGVSMYIRKHMCITTINKEATDLNESKERYIGGLGGKEGKGK